MKERRGLEERSREERREKGMSVVERRDGWEEGSVGERDVLSYPPPVSAYLQGPKPNSDAAPTRTHRHTRTHTHRERETR